MLLAADLVSLAKGNSPFVRLASALVARRKAEVEDQEAGRVRPFGSRASERAVHLLTDRLASALRQVTGSLWNRQDLILSEADGGGMLLLDHLLLGWLKRHRTPAGRLQRLEDAFRADWEGAKRSLDLEQGSQGREWCSQRAPESREVAARVLCHWTLTAGRDAGINRAQREHLNDADRATQASDELERLIQIGVTEVSIDELRESCLVRNAASAQGSSRPPHVRQALFAEQLWDIEVRAMWDKSESLHRVRSCPSAVYRSVQAHLAKYAVLHSLTHAEASGSPPTDVSPGTLGLLPVNGAAAAASSTTWRPSVVTSRLFRWLITDARGLKQEGAFLEIDGGYEALAAQVFHPAETTATQRRDVRQSLAYLSRLRVAVLRRGMPQLVWANLVFVEHPAPPAGDLRRRSLRLRVGDAFSLSEMPKHREMKPGVRQGQRLAPPLRFAQLPPPVLGSRVRLQESILADELIRRMVESFPDYAITGFLVDSAALKSLLQFAGLRATVRSAERLREAWLGESGSLHGSEAGAPLFVETTHGTWQINPTAWPEGHAFLLEGAKRSLDGIENAGRVQKRGRGGRR